MRLEQATFTSYDEPCLNCGFTLDRMSLQPAEVRLCSNCYEELCTECCGEDELCDDCFDAVESTRELR